MTHGYCDWCKGGNRHVEEIVLKEGRAVRGKEKEIVGYRGRKAIKVCRSCKPIVERQLALGPNWKEYEDRATQAIRGG